MRIACRERATCPGCGRGLPEDELACSLCGTPVRGPAYAPPPPPASTPWPTPVCVERPPRVLGLPIPAFALLAGAALAPVLTFTPVLRYAGWFLGSLFHETGHAVAGWALGCAAYPAIRLDGHAAAVHAEWSAGIALLVTAALAALAWRQRGHRVRCGILVAAAIAQVLLAFTSAREAVFLAAGHLGEIAFAVFFLARGIAGGFTESLAERVAHAALGAYLLGRNLWLSGGLLWSEDVRVWYEDSGSFGLVNDYARLAGECFGVPLATVAAGSFVVAVAAVPVAVLLGRRLQQNSGSLRSPLPWSGALPRTPMYPGNTAPGARCVPPG